MNSRYQGYKNHAIKTTHTRCLFHNAQHSITLAKKFSNVYETNTEMYLAIGVYIDKNDTVHINRAIVQKKESRVCKIYVFVPLMSAHS